MNLGRIAKGTKGVKSSRKAIEAAKAAEKAAKLGKAIKSAEKAGRKVLEGTNKLKKTAETESELAKAKQFLKPKRVSSNAKIVWPSKPHTNGTEGHWETIQKKANELAGSGEYRKIYVNKGLSNEIPNAKPNRRPDIMAVKPDGKIDQFEVPSKTDTVRGLYDRMMDNKKIIGERAGNVKVVPIPKK